MNLHLLQARCKHLGTENNLNILKSIYEEVSQVVEYRFRTPVTTIENLGAEGYRLTTEKGDQVSCKWLIAAPGRSGAEWFANQCKDLGIELINNQVDIGVRVELPAKVFEHITDVVYESKLVYRTKQYGDQVRTFCMNPYGTWWPRTWRGSTRSTATPTPTPPSRARTPTLPCWCPTALPPPSTRPYRYGKHIASLSNMLAGGVLVQRFGDLVGGIRTNEHRLSKSFVRPTLTAATPGDLSLALPKRQLDDIIEMIYQLDKLAPGTANYDTLLYGAEGEVLLLPPGPIRGAGDRPAQLLRHRRRGGSYPGPGPGGRLGGEGGPGHLPAPAPGGVSLRPAFAGHDKAPGRNPGRFCVHQIWPGGRESSSRIHSSTSTTR